MTEKRFTVMKKFDGSYVICDKGKMLVADDCCDLLNTMSDDIEEVEISIKLFEDDVQIKDKKISEQQATITNLQGEVERLKYIIDELRKDNYKRFEKINELQAQLREKEREERLYANEILELRETNKEHIKFKSLGGDY